jgi:hypothetical protein
MRTSLLTIAAAVLFAMATLSASQAMTLGTASGLRSAIEQTASVEDAVYVCRHRYWSSKRRCWWQPTYRGWRWHWRRWR